MKKIILSIFVLLLFPTAALAAIQVDSIQISRENREINIICRAESTDVPVGLTVYDKIDPAQVAVFDQGEAINGICSFSAIIGERFLSKHLQVCISSVNDGKYITEIYLPSETDMNNFLLNIKDSQNPAELEASIDYYLNTIPVINNVVKNDYMQYKAETIRLMNNVKIGFKNFDDVSLALNNSIAVAMLNISDAGGFKTVFTNTRYGKLFGIQLDDYINNQSLSNDVDTLINIYRNDKSKSSSISATGMYYDNMEQAKLSIEEAFAVSSVNISAVSNLGDALRKFSALFSRISPNFTSILETDYKMLGETEINKVFVDEAFHNAKQITDKFNYIIEQLKIVGPARESGGSLGNNISVHSTKTETWSGGNSGMENIPNNNEYKFVDLANFQWAKDSIDALSKKGIVSGVGNGYFQPQLLVLREEFIKMAVMLSGGLTEDVGENFKDVLPTDWYYKYINTAVKKGLVNGLDKEIFGVGKYITREDMACILYRLIASETLTKVNETSFTDMKDVSEYAKKAVSFLNGIGAISGMGDGYFLPKENTTRAQSAQIIYNIMKIMERQ